MGDEQPGAAVKRLRREAGLTQPELARRAGISERWLRAWELGQREPSHVAQGWVVEALAKRLVRSAEDVRRELGSPRSAPGERLRTAPLRFAPRAGGARATVERLLAGALDGWSDGEHVHRYPSFLQQDTEGTLFLMERHNEAPSVADLRSDYVVIYVRWAESEGAVRFDAAGGREPEVDLPDVGPLPFLGVSRGFALPISDGLLARAGAAPAGRDRPVELRVRALVTPICRERTSPSVPRLLSSVLSRPVEGGPVTARDFTNWLNLAQSIATAIWSLHASGWAHLAVAAENIVLRVDHGSWRDITLFNVWDGGRLSAGKDARSVTRGDLFDLGRILLAALVGRPVDIDQEELRPPLFEARGRFRKGVHGEMNRRALNLCLRYLLESPPAGQPSSAPPAAETSAQVLMKFINELGALRVLHHERGIARPPLRVLGGGSGSTVRPPPRIDADTLVASAVPSSRPSGRTVSGGTMPAVLSTACTLVEPQERKAWCDRYIALPGVEDGAAGIDAGVDLLARGYGRAAGALMRRIVDSMAATLTTPEATRLLRLLVGLLLQREGALGTSREILSRFVDSEDRSLRWWASLLDHRLSAEHRRRPTSLLARWVSCGDAAEDARARTWELSHEYFMQLRAGRGLSEAQVREVTRQLHGESAHEAIFGALLLARAGAHDRSAGGLMRGMRSILFALSYSATKKLPHEYAASLVLGAWLVRAAARDERLRGELSAQGMDIDECLVMAAECDLQAAEMYQWLDVPTRSCDALQAAARCLFLCEAPERVLHGFRWLSLARNQRQLCWSPPDLIAEGLRETRFVEPRHTETAQVFNQQEEDRALAVGVGIWSKRSAALPGGGARRDPGAMLADNYYDLYGPGIEWAFGTGAVSVELLEPGPEGGPAAPRLGATVDALFAMAERTEGVRAQPPQRVLDLGCGTGAEAIYLASRGFDVLGIDSSAWAIQRACGRAASDPEGRRARFLCLDPTTLDVRAEALEEGFDFVLLRDSAAHFVQKHRVLDVATACLKRGGMIIGCDWVQRRTASRWAWWRLFETVWYAVLESDIGMEDLLRHATLAKVHTEPRDDDMRAFFEHRFEWVSSGAHHPVGSTDEMAVRLRARSDLATMRDICSPEGPVGWLFFCARKPA